MPYMQIPLPGCHPRPNFAGRNKHLTDKMEMKRLSQKILLALTMMCSLWLTSCDEDISLSMTLSGKWKGDWGMYYVYEYRGHEMIFNCYDTHIEFFPDYDMATSGYGRQIDYYDDGPYAYQYYYFHWSVRDGVIYLSYPGNRELNTSISEYSMTSNVFTGYFIDAHDRFRLYKWADYYDWSPYNTYYSFSLRPSWTYPYYAPTRGTEENSEGGRIVARGNRYLPSTQPVDCTLQ